VPLPPKLAEPQEPADPTTVRFWGIMAELKK
jgi:hypothetical protein